MSMRHITSILLIDDDAEDREFFQDALQEVMPEATLYTAENGIEGLDMLQNDELEPDIIFLDLNMPIKNGYDCINDIKADHTLGNIPVVIFSTSLQPETTEMIYNSGANLYMVKPNSFADLKKLLKKVLIMNWVNPLPIPKESFIFQV